MHSRALKEATAWTATEHWPDLTVTEGNEGLQQQQQQHDAQQRVINFHDIDNVREFDLPPTPGDSYDIFFANVTSLGTKVKTWVRSALDLFHVFAFVETHVTDKNAAAISRFFEKRGLVSSFSHATSTNKGGTSGGAVVCTKSHLTCNLGKPSWASDMVRMTGHDWTASIHRLHGISFVFFCAYFNCNGDDPVGTNNKKFYQILECLRGL